MLLQQLFRVTMGKGCWEKIRRHYHICPEEKMYVFPECDERLNRIAEECIQASIKTKFYTELCFVVVGGVRGQIQTEKLEAKIKWVEISHREMNFIIDYFMFCSQNCVIISLTRPEGRNLDRIIGLDGLTVEEIVQRCIFNLL